MDSSAGVARSVQNRGNNSNQEQIMKLNNRIYRPAALLSDFDRIFSRAFHREGNTPRHDVGVYESEQAWFLRTDLPGCSRKNISLAYEGNTLTLSAERDSKCDGFPIPATRSFRIPENVNARDISARLENGVLEITLPKMESDTPDRLEIEVQ